jgi:ADP-ribose pyrophosphatase YjhB (NUDIX family)
MRQATLLFLVKNNQILLAMKKRGFGVNRWNGVGGKPILNENILNTAIRETQEEIGVTPKNISQVATLDFYFQNNPILNQQVIVFLTKEWEGKICETEEMNPKWFNVDKLPFESMWPDDPFWLPLVLANKKFRQSLSSLTIILF